MPNPEGSFVRWQSIRIAQLGYSVNLILTLSVASLGFALALAKDREFAPDPCGRGFLLASLLVLVVSAGLGVGCTINRLGDFRETTRIARDRENWKRGGVSDVEIDERLGDRRRKTDELGERTWLIFYWQIRTFAGGDLALIIAFVIAYHTRLF